MGIPLAALSVRPPEQPRSPVDTIARAMQLKNMKQANEANAFELEKARREKQDQETVSRALIEAGGDFDKGLELAGTRNVSPGYLQVLRTKRAEEIDKLAQADEHQLKAINTRTELISRALQTVKEAPEASRAVIWKQQLAFLRSNGIDLKSLPGDYPGEAVMPQLEAMINMNGAVVKEANERNRARLEEKKLEEETRKIKAEADIAGQEAKLTPEARAALKQRTDTSLSELELWKQQNPGEPVSSYWRQKAAIEASAKANAEMDLMKGPGMTPGAQGVLPDDPGIAAQVKAMVEGRMQFPGAFALRSPYWQGMLRLAAQYDPQFDTTLWKARSATRTEFAKGKAAANIRSLNTTIGHLDDFKKASDRLKNSSVKMWNWVANNSLEQTGDPRVRDFLVKADAVAGEAATLFKGTAGTDQEIREWRRNLNYTDSPEQLEAAYQGIVSLLGSRMDALDYQYQQGMKQPRDVKFLSPRSARILQSLGRNDLTDKDVVVAPEVTAEAPVTTPSTGQGEAPAAKPKTWKELKQQITSGGPQ